MSVPDQMTDRWQHRPEPAPGEIEEALLRAVRLAAMIGLPDPVRTESIPAFLVLAEGQRVERGARARDPRVCEDTDRPTRIIRVRSSSSTACRRRPRAKSCERASGYLIRPWHAVRANQIPH
jgi:hypothetical protein